MYSINFDAFISCVVYNTCTQHIPLCCIHTLLPVLSCHFLCCCQVTGSKWHMDKLIKAKLTDKDHEAFVKKFNSSNKPRLFWTMNKGKPSIPFSGVPFATAGNWEICCKTTGKDNMLENVSSYNCGAKIYFRSIWNFPLPPFWRSTAGVCVCVCVYVCACVCAHRHSYVCTIEKK